MNKLVDAFMETLEPAPPSANLDDELISLDERCTLAEEQVVVLRNRLAMVEDNQKRMALNMLSMLERMKAMSTAAPQSAIILPDHFN